MGKEQKNPTPQEPTRPLRPALIASKQTIDDYSLLLKHLLTGFADQSIPSALICPPQCDIDPIAAPGVELIRHPVLNLPLMTGQNKKRLVENLRRFKPTVIHCLCHSESALARYLSAELSLPYMLNVNSLQKRFNPLALSHKRLAKIIAPAESIRANLVEIYPKYAERIERIDIGTFVNKSRQYSSDISRTKCMITAHPIDNAADYETLLKAVRHLAIDGYDFMLLIAAEGRDEKQLRKLIDTLDLQQVVTIIGRLRPWRSVVSAADIFIQPQPMSDFNPLLLEAMSVGAAVAACASGVDELIIDSQTAIIFDPSDELSIYDKLHQFLDRPELTASLANQARQHLKENHSVSDMVSTTLKAYTETCDFFGAPAAVS